MRISKYLILTLVLWALSNSIQSQTSIYSPYSRYGLGDLSYGNNAQFLAMGGLNLSLGGRFSINQANPASYSLIDTNTFLFESGISSLGVMIKSSNLSGSANYSSLSGLQMAFPITRRWGASIGLLPYSQMGYRLSYSETFDSVGGVHYLHKGYGGLNQFYFGHAIKPLPNLSIGINATWLFGSLNKTQLVDFDSSTYFDIKHQMSTIIGDFYFDFGLRYKVLLSEREADKASDDISLDLGLIYGASTRISAREDILSVTVIANQSTGFEYVKDTVEIITGQKNSLLIPQKFGAALSLNLGYRWMLGTQYISQDWSNYDYNGNSDSLQNSWQASFGIQYLPDFEGKSYWERIRYRAGFRYNQSYLNLRDTPLSEYGMSFGFGFPLKTNKTTLNLGVELGRRGTTENNLVLENFSRVNFGITVSEPWFYKRKYN
jgi:hypothetical protein